MDKITGADCERLARHIGYGDMLVKVEAGAMTRIEEWHKSWKPEAVKALGTEN
jgi:hypothetical protein